MSMTIIIDKEFNNVLLSRKQIHFKILHQKMPTPPRMEVREKIAAQFNADVERVIISKLNTKYGQELTVGYAKIYDSVEKRDKIEAQYIIKRNQKKGKEEAPSGE
jgi:ribosomal protein S24E